MITERFVESATRDSPTRAVSKAFTAGMQLKWPKLVVVAMTKKGL